MSQVTLLTGAVWGIAGAVVMVVIMQAMGGDDPPPFAVFWAKFVGGSPDDAMPQSLILHAINSVVYGVVYVLIFSRFDLGFPITGITGGVIWGVVWAIILMIVAAMFWVNMVLDMDPEPQQVRTMAIAHLGYGLTLGILGAAVPHLV